MSYNITQYTLDRAKQLGVVVKPSTSKGKKIDVFKNGSKVASVGALGYGDYPTYLQLYGKEYADKRRKYYKIRHEKDRHIIDSNGWYSDQLLW